MLTEGAQSGNNRARNGVRTKECPVQGGKVNHAALVTQGETEIISRFVAGVWLSLALGHFDIRGTWEPARCNCVSGFSSNRKAGSDGQSGPWPTATILLSQR